jgi:hypothetical protein
MDMCVIDIVTDFWRGNAKELNTIRWFVTSSRVELLPLVVRRPHYRKKLDHHNYTRWVIACQMWLQSACAKYDLNRAGDRAKYLHRDEGYSLELYVSLFESWLL